MAAAAERASSAPAPASVFKKFRVDRPATGTSSIPMLAARRSPAHLPHMPIDPSYAPDPLFQSLGPEFADPVVPADFPACTPRFWNARAAGSVGLGHLGPEERAAHFCRFEPLPDNQARPLAMRYHGH